MGQPDLRLAVFPLLIGALACFSATTLLSRAAASSKLGKFGWLVASACACAFGNGIWTVHLVNMAGGNSFTPMEYETGLSSVIAIFGTLSAFTLALRPNPTWGIRVGAGTIMAGAITAMPYAGMAAPTFSSFVAYDGRSMIAAVGLGAAFSTLAFRRVRQIDRLSVRFEMAALLLLGVAAMHFVAIVHMMIMPGFGRMPSGLLESAPVSTATATTASVVTIFIGLIVALADQSWRRLEQEALRLQQLADSTIEGLLIHRQGRVIWANAALRQLVGSFKARSNETPSFVA